MSLSAIPTDRHSSTAYLLSRDYLLSVVYAIREHFGPNNELFEYISLPCTPPPAGVDYLSTFLFNEDNLSDAPKISVKQYPELDKERLSRTPYYVLLYNLAHAYYRLGFQWICGKICIVTLISFFNDHFFLNTPYYANEIFDNVSKRKTVPFPNYPIELCLTIYHLISKSSDLDTRSVQTALLRLAWESFRGHQGLDEYSSFSPVIIPDNPLTSNRFIDYEPLPFNVSIKGYNRTESDRISSLKDAIKIIKDNDRQTAVVLESIEYESGSLKSNTKIYEEAADIEDESKSPFRYMQFCDLSLLDESSLTSFYLSAARSSSQLDDLFSIFEIVETRGIYGLLFLDPEFIKSDKKLWAWTLLHGAVVGNTYLMPCKLSYLREKYNEITEECIQELSEYLVLDDTEVLIAQRVYNALNTDDGHKDMPIQLGDLKPQLSYILERISGIKNIGSNFSSCKMKSDNSEAHAISRNAISSISGYSPGVNNINTIISLCKDKEIIPDDKPLATSKTKIIKTKSQPEEEVLDESWLPSSLRTNGNRKDTSKKNKKKSKPKKLGIEDFRISVVDDLSLPIVDFLSSCNIKNVEHKDLKDIAKNIDTITATPELKSEIAILQNVLDCDKELLKENSNLDQALRDGLKIKANDLVTPLLFKYIFKNKDVEVPSSFYGSNKDDTNIEDIAITFLNAANIPTEIFNAADDLFDLEDDNQEKFYSFLSKCTGFETYIANKSRTRSLSFIISQSILLALHNHYYLNGSYYRKAPILESSLPINPDLIREYSRQIIEETFLHKLQTLPDGAFDLDSVLKIDTSSTLFTNILFFNNYSKENYTFGPSFVKRPLPKDIALDLNSSMILDNKNTVGRSDNYYGKFDDLHYSLLFPIPSPIPESGDFNHLSQISSKSGKPGLANILQEKAWHANISLLNTARVFQQGFGDIIQSLDDSDIHNFDLKNFKPVVTIDNNNKHKVKEKSKKSKRKGNKKGEKNDIIENIDNDLSAFWQLQDEFYNQYYLEERDYMLGNKLRDSVAFNTSETISCSDYMFRKMPYAVHMKKKLNIFSDDLSQEQILDMLQEDIRIRTQNYIKNKRDIGAGIGVGDLEYNNSLLLLNSIRAALVEEKCVMVYTQQSFSLNNIVENFSLTDLLLSIVNKDFNKDKIADINIGIETIKVFNEGMSEICNNVFALNTNSKQDITDLFDFDLDVSSENSYSTILFTNVILIEKAKIKSKKTARKEIKDCLLKLESEFDMHTLKLFISHFKSLNIELSYSSFIPLSATVMALLHTYHKLHLCSFLKDINNVQLYRRWARMIHRFTFFKNNGLQQLVKDSDVSFTDFSSIISSKLSNSFIYKFKEHTEVQLVRTYEPSKLLRKLCESSEYLYQNRIRSNNIRDIISDQISDSKYQQLSLEDKKFCTVPVSDKDDYVILHRYNEFAKKNGKPEIKLNKMINETMYSVFDDIALSDGSFVKENVDILDCLKLIIKFSNSTSKTADILNYIGLVNAKQLSVGYAQLKSELEYVRQASSTPIALISDNVNLTPKKVDYCCSEPCVEYEIPTKLIDSLSFEVDNILKVLRIFQFPDFDSNAFITCLELAIQWVINIGKNKSLSKETSYLDIKGYQLFEKICISTSGWHKMPFSLNERFINDFNNVALSIVTDPTKEQTINSIIDNKLRVPSKFSILDYIIMKEGSTILEIGRRLQNYPFSGRVFLQNGKDFIDERGLLSAESLPAICSLLLSDLWLWLSKDINVIQEFREVLYRRYSVSLTSLRTSLDIVTPDFYGKPSIYSPQGDFTKDLFDTYDKPIISNVFLRKGKYEQFNLSWVDIHEENGCCCSKCLGLNIQPTIIEELYLHCLPKIIETWKDILHKSNLNKPNKDNKHPKSIEESSPTKSSFKDLSEGFEKKIDELIGSYNSSSISEMGFVGPKAATTLRIAAFSERLRRAAFGYPTHIDSNPLGTTINIFGTSFLVQRLDSLSL